MIYMELNREDIRQMMVKENKDDLKKVQDYLKYHPLSNILQVYAKTGVSMSQILHFIKYGVLKFRLPKAG